MYRKLISFILGMIKKNKEISYGAIYSFSAKILAYVISFCIGLIGARFYGASALGDLAIINSIVFTTAMFCMLGFPTLLLKLIPKYIQKHSKGFIKRLYYRSLTILFLVFAIIYVGFLFIDDLIATTIFKKTELLEFVQLSTLFVLIHSIHSVNVAVIQAFKKSKVFAFFELLPKVLTLLLLISFIVLMSGKNDLIYVLFITLTLMTFFSTLYVLRFLYKSEDKSEENQPELPSRVELIQMALPMFVIGSLHLVMSQTDTLMIGALTTSYDLGIYNVAFSLSLFTSFVLNSVNVISAPKFSELYHSNQMEELKSVALKSSQLILFGTLPIVLVLAVFGKIILSLYGEDFIMGYTVLLLLILGQLVSSFVGSVGYFLNMTNNQNKLQNILIIAAILNIILNYVLIPKYGINGAAFATMLSTVLWNITAAIYIKYKFGFFISSFFEIFKFEGKPK